MSQIPLALKDDFFPLYFSTNCLEESDWQGGCSDKIQDNEEGTL